MSVIKVASDTACWGIGLNPDSLGVLGTNIIGFGHGHCTQTEGEGKTGRISQFYKFALIP